MPQNENESKENPQKIVQTAGRTALGEFAPDFAHFNDDILFGENWNNHDIDLKTRCIITVVALMSQGITDNSLKYHLENAKKNGVTKNEIAAVVTHVAFYAGWPKAWAVFISLRYIPAATVGLFVVSAFASIASLRLAPFRNGYAATTIPKPLA